VQILGLEFLLDIGLEAAAPEPGVEQVASGAARQRAMGAQWLGCRFATRPTTTAYEHAVAPDTHKGQRLYLKYRIDYRI
jgi:hypothetical protein